VPVGYPVDKTRIYITRNGNELTDIFEFGEIIYQSDYLALGYWNDEEKTKQAFPIDIVNTGERYYKSGDIGRMLSNGMIEFKGRNDNQVKIRGFRVELGEIENLLVTHEQIKEAIVIAKERQDDKYLIAYYVSDSEIEITVLKVFLLQKLPDYMIPTYYEHLNSIPLTPNGKIDKNALPDPEIKASNDYIAPLNEIEEKLVEIWSEVLKIEKEQISVDRSFFELGGHSLKAILIASKINEVFDVKIPLDDIFNNPTIKGIVTFIKTIKPDDIQYIYDNNEREEVAV
jgi:acyl carrier protein